LEENIRVVKLEIKLITKFVEGLPEKRLSRLINIVETIYQRITLRSSDKVQEAPIPHSLLSLRGFLVARQCMNDIETQKAMATIVSRHQSGKAGGLYRLGE
jgi:hypothetical protein